MPYVEVWVDEEACDGTCASGKELDGLKAVVAEAVHHLRHGDSEAALHALTNDPAIPLKTPKEISDAYQKWKAGNLTGFIPYSKKDAAHV